MYKNRLCIDFHSLLNNLNLRHMALFFTYEFFKCNTHFAIVDIIETVARCCTLGIRRYFTDFWIETIDIHHEEFIQYDAYLPDIRYSSLMSTNSVQTAFGKKIFLQLFKKYIVCFHRNLVFVLYMWLPNYNCQDYIYVYKDLLRGAYLWYVKYLQWMPKLLLSYGQSGVG